MSLSSTSPQQQHLLRHVVLAGVGAVRFVRHHVAPSRHSVVPRGYGHRLAGRTAAASVALWRWYDSRHHLRRRYDRRHHLRLRLRCCTATTHHPVAPAQPPPPPPQRCRHCRRCNRQAPLRVVLAPLLPIADPSAAADGTGGAGDGETSPPPLPHIVTVLPSRDCAVRTISAPATSEGA